VRSSTDPQRGAGREHGTAQAGVARPSGPQVIAHAAGQTDRCGPRTFRLGPVRNSLAPPYYPRSGRSPPFACPVLRMPVRQNKQVGKTMGRSAASFAFAPSMLKSLQKLDQPVDVPAFCTKNRHKHCDGSITVAALTQRCGRAGAVRSHIGLTPKRVWPAVQRYRFVKRTRCFRLKASSGSSQVPAPCRACRVPVRTTQVVPPALQPTSLATNSDPAGCPSAAQWFRIRRVC
jgi:hypothetical protein